MKTLSSRNRTLMLTASAMMALTLFAAGCGGKKTPLPPPPPAPTAGQTTPTNTTPSAARPTATLTAEPSRIERGQAANLTWTTTDATDVSINNGLGTLPASGTRSVSPSDTTTYTLTANGPNGSTTATATVTITAPPPPPGQGSRPNNPGSSFEARVQSELKRSEERRVGKECRSRWSPYH